MKQVQDLAIILAAGEGRRLAPLRLDLPKCLIPVGQRSFLQRSLTALTRYPFRDICVVGGYRAETIVRFVEDFSNVHVCLNPDYARSNNACSLRVSLQEHPGRPFVLLDGDLLFDERILEGLLHDPRPDLLVVETDRGALDAEAMKVAIETADGSVREIGKGISQRWAGGEFIGMLKLSEKWGRGFMEEMDLLGPEAGSLYYEDVIQRLLPRLSPPHVFPVNGLPWAEVDTPEDLERASRFWKG